MMSEIDVYKEWLGIPEGDRPPNHYTLLRLVLFEDDIEKIRGNYRKLDGHVRRYATGQYLKQSQDLLNELAKAMLCLTDPAAKAEYDTSMGREPDGGGIDHPSTVLEFLAARELISRVQIGEVEKFADARGLSHRDAVVQMKLVEPLDACQALASELGRSWVELEEMLPDDSVLDMIPRRVVKKHSCLPLFEDRGYMLVACSDEPSIDLEEEIRLRCSMPMRPVLALPRSINQAIAKYYAPGARDEAATPDSVDESIAAGSGGKKKKAAPPKARARSSASPLTDEQKRERLMLTLIVTCWSTIGTVGLIYFLNNQEVSLLHAALGLIVGGIVFGLMKTFYAR